ncbi:MAG: hypothetical protein ABJD58_06745 [Cyclobacteriaceae bacterium]
MAQPGFQRFAFFFLASQVLNISSLASFGAFHSLVQFVSFSVSIGFSTILIVKVAQSSNFLSAVRVFWKYLISVLIISILIALVVPVMVESGVRWLWYLMSVQWSVYFVQRNFYLGLKKYEKLFVFDILFFIASLLGLAIFRSGVIGFNSGFFLSSLYFVFHTKPNIQKNKVFLTFKSYKNVALNSLSNIISTGMQQLLPFLISIFYSELTTALVTLVFSFGIIIYLSSRALSYKYYPLLSLLEAERGTQVKKYFLENVFLLSFCTIFVILLFLFFRNVLEMSLLQDSDSVLVFLSAVGYLFVSQISVPLFVFLNCKDNHALQVKLNLYAFLAGLLIFCFMHFEIFHIKVSVMFIGLSMIYFIRLVYLIFVVRKLY